MLSLVADPLTPLLLLLSTKHTLLASHPRPSYSQTANSSTQASPPHPQLEKMMTGGEREGSDATGPEERTQKVWGPNARAAEFNAEIEGRRNPVLDGELLVDVVRGWGGAAERVC